MVGLVRKLKLTKTCQKPLENHTSVLLCKKRLQKIANIRKIMAKIEHRAKAIAFAKWSAWIEN